MVLKTRKPEADCLNCSLPSYIFVENLDLHKIRNFFVMNRSPKKCKAKIFVSITLLITFKMTYFHSLCFGSGGFS